MQAQQLVRHDLRPCVRSRTLRRVPFAPEALGGTSKNNNSSGERSDNVHIPVVIPDAAFPPPSRGNQYQRQDRPSDDFPGSGGRGGGVFSMFGSGGDGWSGKGKFSNGLMNRLRLMMLSMLWATCVYMVLSSAFRALAWLNRKMGITASLGYGPGARLPFATDWGHADHAGQEATDGTDEIEVVSVLHATGLTPAGAEIAGKARVDAGLSSLQGVAADAAWVEGVTRQATRADAGVVGGGEARTAAVAAVAGSEGSAAAAAEFGLAAPLDEEQLAHLQALKRYEARKTQSKTSSTAAGQQSETSFAGHAAAAYCMVFATLAFFFVVQ